MQRAHFPVNAKEELAYVFEKGNSIPSKGSFNMDTLPDDWIMEIEMLQAIFMDQIKRMCR